MKAIWNNKIIAESENTIVIENNHYFPPNSINKEYFSETDTHTMCPWKGTASYYNINVDDNVNNDAAWFYPEPKSSAEEIKNYVAFWKGVQVSN
ncbi:DUF427 domain-containing protein [Candidatus Kapabacteria bacterium]|nr:DUF427 domain-containing protein [Candidatus Kapabacteria bacterium]